MGTTKKFSEIRRPETPERRARIDAIKTRMEAAEQLVDMRRSLGLTQADMAARLGVSQGSVSELEHRDDALLSTVRAYVEALGGKLTILVDLGDGEDHPVVLGQLASFSDETMAQLNNMPAAPKAPGARAGSREATPA